MRKLFVVLCLPAICLLWSCGTGGGASATDGYVISGKTTNFPVETQVYLDEVNGRKVNVLDTATIAADGSFEMTGKIKEKGLGRLRVGKSSILVVLEDAPFKVTMDANAVNKYEIDGPYETKELDRLFKDYQARKISNDYLKKYVDTVKSIHLGYFAINILKPDEAFDQYKNFNARLQKEMPSSPIAQEFSQRVASMKKTQAVMVGNTAPEINLPSPDGKSIPLSSMKGKVVLLDFWASWCRPCRRENPNVVKMYDQYKKKGFEVYSVSLDKTKDRWVKAIADDNLKWDGHVSDLAGWKSSAAALYGVRSIPQTFLIDKDGKIVGKNLRGPALENKLKEIFTEA